MSIQTYKDLKSAVAEWMDRPGLSGDVPSVVTQGNISPVDVFCSHVEAECNRRLRTEDMVTIIFNSGCESQSVVLLPDNILAMRLVTINGVDADYLTPEMFTTAEAIYCEKPLYTRVANQIHVYPEMAVADDITIIAYVTVPPLVNDDDVNWLLRKFPDVYLYGCLYEASAYVFDVPHEERWGQKFNQAIQDLIDGDTRDRWSGSTMKVRSV